MSTISRYFRAYTGDDEIHAIEAVRLFLFVGTFLLELPDRVGIPMGFPRSELARMDAVGSE